MRRLMIWEIHDQKQPKIEGLDDSGRPDPAYAAGLGLVRAPFGRRVLAAICDGAAWMLLQLPFWFGAVPLLLKLATGAISPYGFLNHPGFVLALVMAAVTVASSLVFAIVQLVLHGRKGVTLGKAVAGIRTIDVRTLQRPGVGRVLLRFIIVAVVGAVPVLGLVLLLSPTFDPEQRGRGWHDRASGVWLVDVRNGLQPYDEKRMRIARKMMTVEPVPERRPLPSLATPQDPSAQPEYRPSGRISAGVLGVVRPEAPASPPARPEAPVPPSPAPVPAGFALRLDTGESIPITEPALLGRNPDAAMHPGARPIALPDDSRSLSKTHLLVRPAPGGLEIVDCRSTNGSALIRGGVEYGVGADVPVVVAEGDVIRIGDRTAAVIRA